ncbi:hypothetical protein BRADI_4g34716v3 [Brachypodium distachyon]|uniref:Knottins-like domain-containing protein n=1 Tax=Brachypodium distachyon TaxID=15368 RepID=I1IRM1_BRADI|nr:hypothetical protein BRADI_4g34716v3 [Brachypodium distachyon]
MESLRRFSAAAAILALLLLLVATEAVTAQAYGKKCSKPSGRFKGPCFFKVDCEQQCKKEGWPRGVCTGFAGRCVCKNYGC